MSANSWRILVFLSIAAAPGCMFKDAVEIGDTAETGDSGDSGDTTETAETGDSADTGDSAETGETGETGETAELSFDLSALATLGGGRTLTLTWLDGDSLGSDTLSFGDVLAHTPADTADLTLSTGTPPDGDFVQPNPTDYPGLEIAFYVPAVHEDTDGDGVLSGDETIVGVGQIWAIYARGTIPVELAAAGLVEGWNGADVLSGSDVPEFVPPEDLPVSSLEPVESITVGGSYDLGDTDGVRVLLAPYALFDGGSVDEYLADDAASESWSLSVDGAPPDDHLSEVDGLASLAALEFPIAYLDADSSASFTDGDTPIQFACKSEGTAVLLWLPPPTDLEAAVGALFTGVGTGWSALSIVGDGAPTPLTGDALLDLEISDACGG